MTLTMKLLTKKQLAEELSLTPAGVQKLTRERKIPVLRISGRMTRYDLDNVRAALGKFEVKAVS